MEYGVCGGVDIAAVAAKAGFDFVEGTVGAVLSPREDEAVFATTSAPWRAAELPCPVVNCFIPGDLKIVGPKVDLAALEQYVRTACRRAQAVGVETIVFGSGGARQIPDGFDAKKAWGQLVTFGKLAAPLAAAHGVTLVIEPLGRKECNHLHTVAEGAAYVQAVGHPAMRLLVDSYHWACNDDQAADITTHAKLLGHVHLATKASRLVPGAENYDFAPFFAALIAGGYDGRLSIEANVPKPAADLPRALTLLQRLVREARGK